MKGIVGREAEIRELQERTICFYSNIQAGPF